MEGERKEEGGGRKEREREATGMQVFPCLLLHPLPLWRSSC